MKNSWIETKDNEDKVRIICFPYAGGGASIYRNWVKRQKKIGFYPLQFPGRENRINEHAYTDMNKLVQAIYCNIIDYIDRPVIFFGHSMGAKIVYEITKILLESEKGEYVKHIIVSGASAPDLPEKYIIHNLNDNKFKKALYEFGGTPEEILQNEELINFFMPLLRADFKLIETYELRNKIKISVPITVLWGKEDKQVDYDSCVSWNNFTDDFRGIKEFPGNHFFVCDESELVFNEIIAIAKQYV